VRDVLQNRCADHEPSTGDPEAAQCLSSQQYIDRRQPNAKQPRRFVPAYEKGITGSVKNRISTNVPLLAERRVHFWVPRSADWCSLGPTTQICGTTMRLDDTRKAGIRPE
jgi:hypothetical protein